MIVAERQTMSVGRSGDATDRVTTITDALNQVTEFTYDPANDNFLMVKDPLNHVTTIGYNNVGQPTSVQGPIATEPPTTFAYDPNGNLLTVTDAKNQTTAYTYDTMDRLKTRTDALNRQESYQYDALGNLIQFTDRKNQQATFIYDALNRRTTATYQGDSPPTTSSFVYDAIGRLIHAAGTAPGAGSIDFRYDSVDRLVQEITGQGAVSYQYDVLGRRTSLMVNGLVPVTYQYDAASRLTQVAQGALTVGLGYDNANRRTSLTYPNGTSTSYAYDVASRLTNTTHNGPSGLIEALTYTYDRAGNRTSFTRANGTASLVPQAVPSATYDAANEQISFAGATLTYDQNGNLTNDGMNSYSWDARNRLAGINGGATASFQYDPLGRRSSKTINGVATQFLYDRNDIVAEMGGGAVGANYLRSLSIDELFGILRQDGVYFSIYDGLGSTLVLTNQAGVPTLQYSYEPFGKTQSSNPAFANPFQFTGRENDSTALYYYRARYYHSGLQRFIEPDPLLCGSLNLPIYSIRKNPQTLNAFAYVNNSPQNFSDPLGLSPDCAYYGDRCFQVKNTISLNYYCGAALYVCQNAGDGPWKNCVRQCLQDVDRDICSQLPSGRKDPFGVAAACSIGPGHGFCFTKCAAQQAVR